MIVGKPTTIYVAIIHHRAVGRHTTKNLLAGKANWLFNEGRCVQTPHGNLLSQDDFEPQWPLDHHRHGPNGLLVLLAPGVDAGAPEPARGTKSRRTWTTVCCDRFCACFFCSVMFGTRSAFGSVAPTSPALARDTVSCPRTFWRLPAKLVDLFHTELIW